VRAGFPITAQFRKPSPKTSGAQKAGSLNARPGTRGEDVLFEWYTTREAKCLDKLIPLDFSGTIQCDGYSAYDHFARHRASAGRPVLLAGCWAHARRGFYEALDHAPKEAGWILIQIGHLYEIDRSWKEELVIFR